MTTYMSTKITQNMASNTNLGERVIYNVCKITTISILYDVIETNLFKILLYCCLYNNTVASYVKELNWTYLQATIISQIKTHGIERSLEVCARQQCIGHIYRISITKQNMRCTTAFNVCFYMYSSVLND